MAAAPGTVSGTRLRRHLFTLLHERHCHESL